MIRFTEIIIKNFGPFKGEQTIALSGPPGVVIIFGENGRGKTMLLNAIRYALFGTIKGRAAQHLSIEDIPNIEAAKEGDSDFSVALRFSQDGHRYELTRKATVRPDSPTPPADGDIREECWLTKDDNVLGPDQTKVELSRIMPEQVSRFFLFDGELLQEYEELLRHESSMGDQIKTAIERILGVPVLTRARQDLSELRTEAQRQEARTATKDQKTQQLQAQLQRLLHDQQERKKILEDKRKEKEALDSKKAANDAEIRKYERVHALLDERDTLEADIAGIEKKTKDKHEKLKEALNDAWKSLLLAKIAATRARLQTEYDTLNSAFIGRTVASQAIQQIETSLAEGSCTTCARPLDSTARTHLEYQLQRIRQAEHPEDNVERRAHLQRSLDSLQALGVTDKRALIADIYDDLDDLRIDKATKTDRINEINDAARSVKETDVRRLWNEQQSLLGELVIVEQAIQAELDAQKTNAEDIRRVETALDKSGDIDLAKERRQREICTQLHDLFDGAVSLYREELRARVEAAATEIFKGLTSDPDYTALRINENYGLYIVHRTGQVVKVRSAGNEHIVALSLMGALQKNAPLKGPIVMDSPFGRLDSTHKTNVVRNLPDMADQVILLVYESEIEPRIARNLLRGKLQREFDMHRVSSFHTRIDEKLGD